MNRLLEKITGRPHQHKSAKLVKNATANLLATTALFSYHIEPYSRSLDPLAALFEDIKNQDKGSGGGHDGRPKFFS